MNWLLPFTITHPRINDMILRLTKKSEEKNIEFKVLQLENEYQNKLKETEELCNNPEDITKIYNQNSLYILQKELDIIRLLTKYTLQNKNIDYNFFISCLNILLNLSEVLRIRLGQKEITHDKQKQNKYNDNSIYRCSYKFCSYKDTCKYNYDLKTKNLCYQDHYVHHMVSADLKILLEYIKTKSNDATFLHNKEVLKTINTLSFVIGHMESELKTKCIYLEEKNWNSCHYVKNK